MSYHGLTCGIAKGRGGFAAVAGSLLGTNKTVLQYEEERTDKRSLIHFFCLLNPTPLPYAMVRIQTEGVTALKIGLTLQSSRFWARSIGADAGMRTRPVGEHLFDRVTSSTECPKCLKEVKMRSKRWTSCYACTPLDGEFGIWLQMEE